MLRFLPRPQINVSEWDRCVAEAHNALLYGHSWYLDAVTNVPTGGPRWRWEGLVQTDETGRYVAVMPVPLRRRWGRWVVYQPLFCQFVAIFSSQPIDPTPFIEALAARYRYASRLCLRLHTTLSNVPAYVQQQILYTHVIGSTDAIPPYSADRQMNLRRARRRVAQTPYWQVIDSDDVRPLLTLFREHHADEIGVGEWAYGLFEQVFQTLHQRGAVRLRYACVGNVPVAGAVFAEQHGRIIYLFNAANAEGRRLNARTLLIDEALQNAAAHPVSGGRLFDFESPDKPGIVYFYESFGATPEPYLQVGWNRLTWAGRLVQRFIANPQRNGGRLKHAP